MAGMVRRVVVVHNWYRSSLPSGENRSVEEEIAGLRDEGVEVRVFERSSDDVLARTGIARLPYAAAPFGLPSVRHRFADLMDSFRPQAVLLENVWPLISPAVVAIARRSGAVVCGSVRNYRLSCLAGTHQRGGRDCHACSPTMKFPGIRHGCLGGSRATSVPVALSSQWYARTLLGLDLYFANSAFTADYLRRFGISDDRIVVRENAVPDPALRLHHPVSTPRTVCFIGRLSPEKGAGLLFDAWERWAPDDLRLVVVGDGEERERAERLAAADGRVVVLGQVERRDLSNVMASSTCVIVPSVWDEPFGRVAIEAMAVGRPVIVTARGALPSIVDDRVGLVVAPTAESIGGAFDWLCSAESDHLAALGDAARQRFRDRFSTERNLAVLVRGLETAIATSGASGGAQ